MPEPEGPQGPQLELEGMTGPPVLELAGIAKSFGGHQVLSGISLTVRKGEFMTFLGPSGCGKTTTLRVIAGFEEADAGLVRLLGREVAGVPPYERDLHTVFQHYALFPHYDVFENAAFGLRIRKLPEAEIQARVAEALALVKLAGFERRRTSSLSGGQMQRVALARALVGRPSLLLLDEPLGALDLKLRKEMQLELKQLQRRLGIAFVYVTHDQEEAMTMSDRIAVFNEGRLEQVGSPAEIYENPRTSFVADFIGSANVLNCRLLAAADGRLRVKLEDEHELELPHSGPAPAPVGELFPVAIRPERIAIRYRVDGPEIAGSVRMKAALLDTVFMGDASQIYFKPFADPGKVVLSVSMEPQHRQRREAGMTVWADIRPKDFLVLERSANGDGR